LFYGVCSVVEACNPVKIKVSGQIRTYTPYFFSITFNMEDKDLYWLAGWLEGEGSFVGKSGNQTKCGIVGACTDEDVIIRVASLFESSYVKSNRRSNDKPHWKDVYKTSIHGNRAKILMLKLYPLMGKRRQEQITKVVNSYQPSKHKFTEELIKEIKSLSGIMSQSKIAQKFDTDRTTINKIINDTYMRL